MTNGSDLWDDFSDSSLEEDLSDESDSLESLPSWGSSFLEGAFRSPPPCDLSSRLVDNDEINFSSFPTMYNTPLLVVIEPFKEMVSSTSSVEIFVSKKSRRKRVKKIELSFLEFDLLMQKQILGRFKIVRKNSQHNALKDT